MKRLLQFSSLLVVLALVLAACGSSATAPVVPELPDPSTIVLDTSGLAIIEEGETAFIDSDGEIYAIFFEHADVGFFPESTQYVFGWAKYSPTAEIWSLWHVVQLNGIEEALLLPQESVLDSSQEILPGEVIISGSYWGEGWCILDTCLLNSFQLWLDFSAGKGG